MKLLFDPLAINTFGRLNGLKSLIKHADKSIPEMERQAQQVLKTLAESEDWDYSDYDVERQNLESVYMHWLPKYTGYSAVILLYSIVETQLLACVNRVINDRPKDLRPNPKRAVLDEAANLIKESTGVNVKEDITWSLLKYTQKLRNIIIHRGGARGDSEKHQKDFDQLLLVIFKIIFTSKINNKTTQNLGKNKVA